MKVTISFEVSDDEARMIRARARREGVSVSAYLRRRALLPTFGSPTPGRVRCPHTGAMIFAAPGDQPRLTAETVRELLYGFP